MNYIVNNILSLFKTFFNTFPQYYKKTATEKFLNDPLPASRLELFSKSFLSRVPQSAKHSFTPTIRAKL